MSTTPLQSLDLYFASVGCPALSTQQDAVALLGETSGTGAEIIVVSMNRVEPGFFDLGNKQAGHLL